MAPGSSSLTLPLATVDPEAFRQAEATLRREGREKAELAKVGPGAVQFVELMDRTASFLLAKVPAAARAASVPSDPVALARSVTLGTGGRLAAPAAGMPEPGAAVIGTYVMTSLLFNELVSQLPGDAPGQLGARPPGGITADLPPTVDEVTVDGHKGKITTTITASATRSESRVSVLIRTKVSGEVRDGSGVVIYSIDNEFTGVATGDVCPEAAGVARAQFSFRGREEYTSNGVKSGRGVIEGFSADIQFKVDDDAKLAGVEFSATSGGGPLENEMLRMAAGSAAPQFEKGWRSGLCIAVVVDPNGGDVEKSSVTKVTAKVRHKIEGNELDKPVEAKLFDGVKSIEPSGKKQKAPATFEYTAGSEDGDTGSVTFESISNRGIGREHLTYTVAGGAWTVSATGTLRTTVTTPVGGSLSNLKVFISDLKLTTPGFDTLTGSGTLRISGEITTTGLASCRGRVDQTVRFNAHGTLVGSGAGATLRLLLDTRDPGEQGLPMTCSIGGVTATNVDLADHAGAYGDVLGEFELPAGGGTKTVSGSERGGPSSVEAAGTFTVVRAGKK